METRPFFLLGDVLVNSMVGAISALLVSFVVARSWNPVLAMLAGMLLGMLVALPLASAFVPLCGAFEIMIPGTLSGMLAGMVVAMAAATRPLTGTSAMTLGAACGLLSLGTIYLLTFVASKRGELGP